MKMLEVFDDLSWLVRVVVWEVGEEGVMIERFMISVMVGLVVLLLVSV